MAVSDSGQLLICRPMSPLSDKPCIRSRILPHIRTRGVDICGDSDSVYIIRSDLHCYIRCTIHLDYSQGYRNDQKYEVFPLHPACSWGDHYVKGPNGFIIINGNSFITVTDLSVPVDIESVSVVKVLRATSTMEMSTISLKVISM